MVYTEDTWHYRSSALPMATFNGVIFQILMAGQRLQGDSKCTFIGFLQNCIGLAACLQIFVLQASNSCNTTSTFFFLNV